MNFDIQEEQDFFLLFCRFEAKVLVNSSLIAVAVADMKKDAKRLVAERALERLQGVMQVGTRE